ncbi:C-type lectin domain family 2 member D-like [Hemicordylus capensis]|uniref:C-type lectin domain family 2 member D-like n=1 Tax=Hemicordylus capensis TaxID=884348 RepID=UPI0023045A52|nr:C-type lectin domain family 2 member D-like [Hemicordylus capensis]
MSRDLLLWQLHQSPKEKAGVQDANRKFICGKEMLLNAVTAARRGAGSRGWGGHGSCCPSRRRRLQSRQRQQPPSLPPPRAGARVPCFVFLPSSLSQSECCKRASWISVTINIVQFIIIIVLAVSIRKQDFQHVYPAQDARPCRNDWIGYQGKCYYFSKEEKNWKSSQDFCSSYNASLVRIENEEMDFVSLYKCRDIYWIDLRREKTGQPWKWSNGKHSTLKVLGDGGNCAYLTNAAEIEASSSGCDTTTHRWICSKSDALTVPNGT